MKPHVLLVDDEVLFTENLSRLLGNRGYRVLTASSGGPALDLLEAKEFDVVVLDLRMPGIDGMSVLRALREGDHPAEVVILTGHGGVDSAVEAVKLGAFDYLTKPCEIAELVGRIDAAWEQKRARSKARLAETVERIIESPSAVFDLTRPRKLPRPPVP